VALDLYQKIDAMISAKGLVAFNYIQCGDLPGIPCKKGSLLADMPTNINHKSTIG